MIAVDYGMSRFVVLPKKIGSNITWEAIFVQQEWVDDPRDDGRTTIMSASLLLSVVSGSCENGREELNIGGKTLYLIMIPIFFTRCICHVNHISNLIFTNNGLQVSLIFKYWQFVAPIHISHGFVATLVLCDININAVDILSI